MANTCTYKPAKVKIIQGVVYTSAMEPLVGAKLVLQSGVSGADRKTIAETTSDDNGRFRFARIPYGRYLVTVSAPNFDTFPIEVRVSRFRSSDEGVAVILAVHTGMGCISNYVVRRIQPWEVIRRASS
jgi:hypothetical protein